MKRALDYKPSSSHNTLPCFFFFFFAFHFLGKKFVPPHFSATSYATENDCLKVPKQAEARRDGKINPQNYNFNKS